MKDSILTVINDFYTMNSNKIVAIYKTGSSCLDFISDKHDDDILIVTKNMEDRIELEAEIKKIAISGSAHIVRIDGTNVDFWVMTEDELTTWGKTAFPVWLFETHYMNLFGPLFGDRVYFNEIFTDCDVDAYKQAIKSYKLFTAYQFMLKPTSRKLKYYYHLLIAVFILENNSYVFTAKQLELINRAHIDGATQSEILAAIENIEWLK